MWKIHGEMVSNERDVMEHFGLKYPPIVKSLLDSDLYKFSMGQTYHHQFGNLKTTWDFKARNVGENTTHTSIYTDEDKKEINNQLCAYAALRFDEDELQYLNAKCPWIKQDYINFLRFWHPRLEDFQLCFLVFKSILNTTRFQSSKFLPKSITEITTIMMGFLQVSKKRLTKKLLK